MDYKRITKELIRELRRARLDIIGLRDGLAIAEKLGRFDLWEYDGKLRIGPVYLSEDEWAKYDEERG